MWQLRKLYPFSSPLAPEESKFLASKSFFQRRPIQFPLSSNDHKAKMVVENFNLPPIFNASTRNMDVRRNSISPPPILGELRILNIPFSGSHWETSSWFLMAYFFVAYLGIVKKKEWPYFFRFHVVMGMLLEISLQVIGTVSRWMPLAVYWGKVGMHIWTAIAFAYLFKSSWFWSA